MNLFFNFDFINLFNYECLKKRPPGTGKTFIGVKLVQLLLHNRKLWWNVSEAEAAPQTIQRRMLQVKPRAEVHRPILMICYTNHALDQFLELIVSQCKLTTGVVRVGGRCKSENLEPFLLTKIKRHANMTRTIDGDIFHRIKDHYRIMKELKEKVQPYTDFIESSYHCVLSYETLSQFLENQNHLEQLKSDPKQSKNYMLLLWLGFIDGFNIYFLIISLTTLFFLYL